MVRLAVFLFVITVLLVVVVQNTTPLLALTIFGIQTPTLPLGIWVLGAIAAGVLTTLITATLLNLGGPRRRRRSRRSGSSSRRVSSSPRPGVPPSSTSQTDWTPPAWTGRQPEEEVRDSTSASSQGSSRTTRRVSEDDWDAPTIDDWDEWAGAKKPPSSGFSGGTDGRSPSNRSSYTTPIEVETVYPENASRFDTSPSDSFYANSYEPSYSSPDDSAEPQDAEFEEKEVWDEWEEEENTVDVSYSPAPEPQSVRVDPPAEPEPPPRRIVEVVRKPQTTQQSGTIYSMSYRSEEEEKEAAEETPTDEAKAEVKIESVETGMKENGDRPIYPTVTPSEEAPATTPEPTEERIRVIIPPYHAPTAKDEEDEPAAAATTVPTVEPEVVEPEPLDDDERDTDEWEEDWDNEWEDGVEVSDESATADAEADDEADLMGDREVWDDWDEWDDEEDEPAPRTPPSRQSPDGNPPLQL